MSTAAGMDQIPFLGQHQRGGGANDGNPLAPDFGPAVAIVHDHENLYSSCLPEQSQGNRAAFTYFNAGIERQIAALNSRVGDGEPTSGQGLADGSTPDLAAAVSGDPWMPISSATTDVVAQTLVLQRFPVGHIHPVRGGQLLEGGSQLGAAILLAVEGQVKVGAGPLPAAGPAPLVLGGADGLFLIVLADPTIPASGTVRHGADDLNLPECFLPLLLHPEASTSGNSSLKSGADVRSPAGACFEGFRIDDGDCSSGQKPWRSTPKQS